MKGITVNDTTFQGKSIALVPRPGNHKEVRITVCGEGTINDISKDDARALRDWLTEWLDEGVPVTLSYDENVTRLVELVKAMRRDITNPSNLPVQYDPSWVEQVLDPALAPFLPSPDPDADLVENVAMELNAENWYDLAPSQHNTLRLRATSLIGIVRAHDKEKP